MIDGRDRRSRQPAGVRRRFARTVRIAAATVAALVAACTLPQPAQATEVWPAPPALVIVAICGPSPDLAATEVRQLELVIGQATPGEVFVLVLPSAAPLKTVYVVRRGDTLDSIAGAYGVTLEALESANPQLGPLGHRDFDLIYEGDRVNVPAAAAIQRSRDLVVTRAPDGPPRPRLLKLPSRPSSPTEFQLTQWQRITRNDQQSNDRLKAEWQFAAAAQLRPWEAAVTSQLERIATDSTIAQALAASADLGASIQEATTTLLGLRGRRVLVLAPGADVPPAMTGLASVHLVVADLADPGAATAWRGAGTGAGATVTVQTPELSAVDLTAAVTGTDDKEESR